MGDGKTRIGWGAVREQPWHFAGLFASKAEAQLRAAELGPDYLARYGQRADDQDTFTSEDPQAYVAMSGSIFEPLPTASDETRLASVAGWIDQHVAVAKDGY